MRRALANLTRRERATLVVWRVVGKLIALAILALLFWGKR